VKNEDLPELWEMTLDLLRHEMAQLWELHELTESFLTKAIAELTEKPHQYPKGLPAEHQYYYDEMVNARYEQLVHVFPSRLRESLLLTAVSTLEHSLDTLCRDLQQQHGEALAPTDLRHKGIRRSKVYIEKVLRLPFPDDSAEWNRLLFVLEIRNVFAHVGGVCPPRLHRQVSADQHLALDDDAEILISSSFITDTLGAMGIFGEQLNAALRKGHAKK
jgi:hypothetical protein